MSTGTLLRPLARESSGPAARLRDNNFDALRVVFASMVVAFHMGLLSLAPGLAWMREYISATFAVQAFFVVSGFLVVMSCENSSSLRSYALKRFRRIVPAYVTVVVAAAVLLSLQSTLPLREYFGSPPWWRYLGYNLILSNFQAPTLPGVFQSNPEPAVNGSLWTIKVEVGFYIVVPLIVWCVRRFGYRTALIALFCLSLAWRLGLEGLSSPDGLNLYARLAKQLPGQLCFFVGGAWAFYRAREGGRTYFLPAVAGVLAYNLLSGMAAIAIAPLAVTAIVTWAALAAPRLPALGRHGDFSYGIYLYHFPIVQTCIAAGLFAWSAGLAVGLIAVLVLACSVVSWFVIESPALAGRSRHVAGPPTRPQSSCTS